MTSPPLARLLDAMSAVYGPLPSSATERWTPPPKSGGFKGRYLWTDAFGVINFLTLYKESGDDKYLTCAKTLVQIVHDVQGRTRDGKSRLPGATDANPLRGGLRIGKENASGPDGDGQYFHYLSIWMFALNRLSLATKESSYNDQAISLAKAIHPHFFVNRSSPHPRMVWKIAMDMSKPLVASEGNLDPIDGYVMFRKLQASSSNSSILEEEISDYKRIMDRKGKHFVSSDTLDLGMSLWAAHWLEDKEDWAADLAKRCRSQLKELFEEGQYLRRNTLYRLAFREFGSCLGIGCSASDDYLRARRDEILTAWEKHILETPDGLRPITQVMYAAALIPGAFQKGYLGPEPAL